MKESQKAALIFLNVVGCAIGWPLVAAGILLIFLLGFLITILVGYLYFGTPLWLLVLFILTMAIMFGVSRYRYAGSLNNERIQENLVFAALGGIALLVFRLLLVGWALVSGANPQVPIEGIVNPAMPVPLPVFLNEFPKWLGTLASQLASNSAEVGTWLLLMEMGLIILGVMCGLFGFKVYPRFPEKSNEL